MIRTLVPVRHGGTCEVTMVDAIASCKIGEHIFLIHRSWNGSQMLNATHAPTGLSTACGCRDINDVLMVTTATSPERLHHVITNALADMQAIHLPELAPEEGLQIEADWQWREQARIDSGEYQVPDVLPGGLTYPKEHYVHLSVTKTESDFMAYTPNAVYGERDKQVRIKFGKYLKKTFSTLTDVDIQQAVATLRAKIMLAETPARLLFTTDREKINEIFETEMCAYGSSVVSCMHGTFDGDEIRPYHVYADSPDVAIAYMITNREEIVARTVVSTKDKKWVRAYGENATQCDMLIDLLDKAGYVKGDLYNNRLTNLGTYKVMLPYIDNGGCQVRDAGKWWVVVKTAGDYEADRTDGTGNDLRPRCEKCDELVDDCSCVFCACCEDTFNDGCSCNMCENCGGCIEHMTCMCSRCLECENLNVDCECEAEEDEENETAETIRHAEVS